MRPGRPGRSAGPRDAGRGHASTALGRHEEFRLTNPRQERQRRIGRCR
jgi:hypothetical protein